MTSDGRPTRLDFDAAIDQPMAGGIDDVGARQEQEGRLGQGRDALDLAMSVWMVVVRRFAADPYGCVSQHGGAAIERRSAASDRMPKLPVRMPTVSFSAVSRPLANMELSATRSLALVILLEPWGRW